MDGKNGRRLALVTGASSGIGRELTRGLAELGWDAIVTARREDRLRDLAGELRAAHGVDIEVLAHDLGAQGGAESLHDRVGALGRPIDALVNNAGFGTYGPAWESDPARTRMMLELNVGAVTMLTQLVVRDMVAQGHGRVLQVASVGAFQPSPFYAAYSATKAYVLSYSQALAWELRQAGSPVTITTLCPGMTATEFHEAANHIKPKQFDTVTMSAREVAIIGIEAMMAGKTVVTPGVANKLSAGMVKMIPRSWATSAAGRMMAPKRA
jgi:uncharacterized protein